MFHLPAKTTLRAYTGRATGQVGVSELAIKRLNMEAIGLCEFELQCSALLDEMTTNEMLKLVPNLQQFIGTVDMGGIVTPGDPTARATHMLAVVLAGLTIKVRIPVVLSSAQLHGGTTARSN